MQARIEVAARLPVDNVVRQFPIHVQARLESLKRRLTQELIDDAKLPETPGRLQLRRDALLEGLSTIVVDNHAPERRGSK